MRGNRGKGQEGKQFQFKPELLELRVCQEQSWVSPALVRV